MFSYEKNMCVQARTKDFSQVRGQDFIIAIFISERFRNSEGSNINPIYPSPFPPLCTLLSMYSYVCLCMFLFVYVEILICLCGFVYVCVCVRVCMSRRNAF